MDYKNIIKKLNEKNTTVYELLCCPHCKSIIDIATINNIEDIYYYRETNAHRYLEKYDGQKPIGIDVYYICSHCGTEFIFTGKLIDTKIELS